MRSPTDAADVTITGVRPFDELVAEAETAPIAGWNFGWLDGRATEERTPWGYARLLAERLARVDSALDVDTGGGEIVNESPKLPRRMVVTESWLPNAVHARRLLEPRGVSVVDTRAATGLPVPDESFELVSARHPVSPQWGEIYRVLVPGGSYFAQHVGPASAFELIEHFRGPLTTQRAARDPRTEARAAESAGLSVIDLRTARTRMEFHDVGAIVWILRKCVWWVPDFTVHRYHAKLVELDAQLRAGRPFVTHSTRHLIEARR
jgi:hypothetical protein